MWLRWIHDLLKQKGAASGFCPLESNTKVANSYLNTGSGNALDADTVDTIHASATPTANRLLALAGDAQFPAGVVDANDITSGHLPIAQMPEGGAWNLLSDLNIESSTFFVGHSGGSYPNKVGINCIPTHTLDIEGAAAQIDINAVSGTPSLAFCENDVSKYIWRYNITDNYLGLYSADVGNASGGWVVMFYDGEAVMTLKNGEVYPSAYRPNTIQVYSIDSSDNKATLGLYLEQTIEAIGTFTPSHKIKVKINGVEYWLQLDAV